MADQAMYHQGNQSVFVGGRLWTLLPPPANDIEEWFKHYGNENHHSSKTGSFTSLQMFHTLDKNGSLYDPAGTES